MLLGPRDFFLSKEAIIYKQVCNQVPGISSRPKRQLYINRYAITSHGFLLVQTKRQLYIYRYAIMSHGFLLVQRVNYIKIGMLLGPRDFTLSKKETIIYKQVCYQVPGISSCPKRQLYINRYAIRSQGFLLVQRGNYI